MGNGLLNLPAALAQAFDLRHSGSGAAF